MKLMAQVSAHVTRIGCCNQIGYLQLVKQPRIGLPNSFVCLHGGFSTVIERVQILHNEFSSAEQTLSRTRFVSVFPSCEHHASDVRYDHHAAQLVGSLQIWYTRSGRSLYDRTRPATNVVISSSCVGASRNRESLRSLNWNIWPRQLISASGLMHGLPRSRFLVDLISPRAPARIMMTVTFLMHLESH